jgi:hypothetical protein
MRLDTMMSLLLTHRLNHRTQRRATVRGYYRSF